MNIVHFLIKDVFRKKFRAFLTILGIAIGICVCIMMLGVGESIKTSFKSTYDDRQIDLIVQEEDQPSILLGRVPIEIMPRINSLPGVRDAAATLLYIHRLRKTAVPVLGWEPNSFLYNVVEVSEGRRPIEGNKEAMVGQALMRMMKEEELDEIKIKGEKFTVVGEYKSNSPYEQYAAVIPLADLQKAIREEGRVSFINIRLKPDYRTDEAIDSVSREIEDKKPGISVMRADAFIAEKTKFIVVGEKFSLLIGLITVIAVALGLANTMVTSSFEKRKFLAILLALGWQKSEVAVLFLCESLLISLLGGAFGAILGFKGTAIVFAMTDIRAFTPVLDIVFLAKIIGMVLGCAIIAAIVPTWITLQSNPIEVIRGE